MGVDSYWKEKQENRCNSRYELPSVSGGCVKRNIKMDSVSISYLCTERKYFVSF